jgi:hypothetical protein
MTITQIKALVNQNLASDSDITAEKHRAVEIELLNCLETQELALKNLSDQLKNLAPLAKGTFVMGDLNGADAIYRIDFSDVGTDDYMVDLSPVSKALNWNNDNDVFFMTREHNSSFFKIIGREVSGHFQNLSIDWRIFKK